MIKDRGNVMKKVNHINFECPYCKNNDFVEIERPLGISGDAYLSDSSVYFGCSACGLIVSFNKDVVKESLDDEKEYKDALIRLEQLKNDAKEKAEQLLALEKELANLKERKANPDRTVREDQELDKLIEIAESNIRTVKSGIDRINLHIKSLSEQIDRLG